MDEKMASAAIRGGPSRSQTTTITGWALAAILGILGCSGQDQTRAVRGPYLQLATPTSTIVRWRTNVACDSRVSFGASPSELHDTRSIAEPTTEHEIAIDGLQPATRYYYAIGTEHDTLSRPGDAFTFTTPPRAHTSEATEAALRIWVTGDTGRCGESIRRCADVHAVRDAYLEFAAETPATHWILLGDLAYPSGTDEQFTEALFETFREVLRNTFAWPVPGNHEFGASNSSHQTGPYFESFTLPTRAEAGGAPSGTEAYYSYDIGNVHLIALDSHGTDPSDGEPMSNWLRRDLQQENADFIIAYWHHPPYSKGSHDSDHPLDSGGRMTRMREEIVPILEAGGVDLQLSGHSHSYERSMLIAGHYGLSGSFSQLHSIDSGDGDPEGDGAYSARGGGGTVYAVVGSSADDLGDLAKHPIMLRGFDYEGSLVLDIQGLRLDAHWIDRKGRVRDRFQISKVDD